VALLATFLASAEAGEVNDCSSQRYEDKCNQSYEIKEVTTVTALNCKWVENGKGQNSVDGKGQSGSGTGSNGNGQSGSGTGSNGNGQSGSGTGSNGMGQSVSGTGSDRASRRTSGSCTK